MDTLFASASRKIPRSGKRRICFPITSRAYYGRSQLLIKTLHNHPSVELELMLSGSILLDKYSRHVADDIEAGDRGMAGVRLEQGRENPHRRRLARSVRSKQG